MSVAETILVAVFSAAATAIGFLLKRRITGAAAQETVSHLMRLAELRSQLEKSGATVTDLRTLDDYIRGAEAGHSAEPDGADAVAPSKVDAGQRHEPDSYWTQGMMNRRAAAQAALSHTQLDNVAAEIEGYLSVEESAQFWRVMDNWKEYRKKASDIAAEEFSGGSIASLIRAVEFKAITDQKLPELEQQLSELRARRDTELS